ncbi:hypothetical protein GCM10025791_14310 [Halioxenophilus aromaticivorans]|uniref:TonB C-terminal domain-containing protein n=1 Tax=Halioxenophilus aromaticivorans TaxID=1306992 RepID=A0AAV3U0P9_9ALTE
MWSWLKSIQASAERAADDIALNLLDFERNHLLPAQYAELLLAIKTASQATTTVQAAASSHFYDRLNSVLATLNNHSRLTPIERNYTGLLLAIWLAPMVLIHWQWIPFKPDASITMPAAVGISINRPPTQLTRDNYLPAKTPSPIPNLKLTFPSPLQEEINVVGSVSPENFGGHNWPAPIITIRGWLAEKQVMPDYPEEAAQMGASGRVEVRFSIDITGHATNIAIVNADPAHLFENSVIAAIKSSRFKPILLDNRPVVANCLLQIFEFRFFNRPLPNQ